MSTFEPTELGGNNMFKSGAFAAILMVAATAGCGGKPKPNPQARPDFIDTTDPSKVTLPTPKGTAPASGAPAGSQAPTAPPPGQTP